MKTVYLSSFWTAFRDYARLRAFVGACENAGAELATSWTYPEFDALLDVQQERFKDVPVTLHAPFVEISGAPDSEERRIMTQAFEKAFRWYDLFGATSMVMHTHEKRVAPGEKEEMIRFSRMAVCDVAATAEVKGIHLTVENVGYPNKGNALFTKNEFVDFIGSLPDEVGALIDTGHAMANHWDIPELVKTLGTRIRGYHLHNTDGVHDLHRPIFEQGLWYDKQEMWKLLETIAEYSPDADLVLEYAPGEHITAELLREDVRCVQSVWR